VSEDKIDWKMPLFISIGILVVWAISGLLLHNDQNRGTFGDMFGAVNALFSGLAFGGVIYAILLQRKELELQRNELELTRNELEGQKLQLRAQNETLEKENFENTFFLLLNLQQQIIQDIDIRLKSQKILRGRRCFRFLYKEYIEEYEKCFKHSSTDEISLISETYFEFYETRQDKLAHYFQTLYNIIKYVNESDPDIDKKKYINIVRAQLSVYELGLIYYNCLTELGKDKFKPLIEMYGLFKNMPKSILYAKHHTDLYSESAFKGAPDWTSTKKFKSDEEEMTHYFEKAVSDQEDDEV